MRYSEDELREFFDQNEAVWGNHTGKKGPAQREDVQRDLCEQGIHAVHYGQKYSYKPDDYGADSQYIEKMVRFSEKGSPCIINYSDIYEKVVGYTGERVFVFAHDDGVPSDGIYPVNRAPEEVPEKHSEADIMKGYRIKEHKRVPKSRYPSMFDESEPRQNVVSNLKGSFATELLVAVFQDEPLPMEWSSLTTYQQELLADEYIRHQYPSIVKVGQERQAIDGWYEIGDGVMLYTQVTKSQSTSTSENKIQRLEKWMDKGDIGYLFAPAEALPKGPSTSPIRTVSLQQAFNVLRDADEHNMIERILGYQP